MHNVILNSKEHMSAHELNIYNLKQLKAVEVFIAQRLHFNQWITPGNWRDLTHFRLLTHKRYDTVSETFIPLTEEELSILKTNSL